MNLPPRLRFFSVSPYGCHQSNLDATHTACHRLLSLKFLITSVFRTCQHLTWFFMRYMRILHLKSDFHISNLENTLIYRKAIAEILI